MPEIEFETDEENEKDEPDLTHHEELAHRRPRKQICRELRRDPAEKRRTENDARDDFGDDERLPELAHSDADLAGDPDHQRRLNEKKDEWSVLEKMPEPRHGRKPSLVRAEIECSQGKT